MNNYFLEKIIAPMYTPFKEDLSLDEIGIKEMLRFLQDKKFVNTVFIRSGVGKMYSFSYEEVKKIIEIATENTSLPIIAGTSGIYNRDRNNKPAPEKYIEETISLTNYAKEKGVKGAVIVIPEAISYKHKEEIPEIIFEYYKTISENVDLPLIIYSPPNLEEGYEPVPKIIKKIASLKNIAGMKYSTSDVGKFRNIAEVVKDNQKFSMIVGAEHIFLEGLKIGAKGVIGGGCNFHPEILYYIYKNFKEGKFEDAQNAQNTVKEILSKLSEVENSIFIMMYLKEKGYNLKPYTRGKYSSISKEKFEEIKNFLDKKISIFKNLNG
jgi:4-hydroxy-tetrahydrodipicolinate synthase